MLRRSALIALSALLAAGAAHAAEEKPKEIGQYVDLSPVALPIASPDGRLVNYVFVQVRILLTGQANAATWRAKEPYFRDALVRAAHRTPFTSPDSYVAIDAAKLKAVMKREAVAIAGPKDIASVAIMTQAPKRSTGLPVPPGRARTAQIRP